MILIFFFSLKYKKSCSVVCYKRHKNDPIQRCENPTSTLLPPQPLIIPSTEPEVSEEDHPWPLSPEVLAARLSNLEEEDPTLWSLLQDTKLHPLLKDLASIPNRLRAAEQVRNLLKTSEGHDLFSECVDLLLKRVNIRDEFGYCLL